MLVVKGLSAVQSTIKREDPELQIEGSKCLWLGLECGVFHHEGIRVRTLVISVFEEKEPN
mgnify:CR=1 FL=1